MDDSELLKLTRSSGFPFQMAIIDAITRSRAEHHWSVASSEHPWQHCQDSGFADAVLVNNHLPNCRAIIECKRRQGTLLFLTRSAEHQKRVRLHWGYKRDNRAQAYGWHDVQCLPGSSEAEYCVVSGDGDKRTMLESLAGKLLLATQAIAEFELCSLGSKPKGAAVFHVPILVTSAELTVATFDPGEVPLDTGIVENASFSSVPYVRFRKSLGPLNTTADIWSLAKARESSDRTVLVVSATYLIELLKSYTFLDLDNPLLPWMEIDQRIDSEDREQRFNSLEDKV